MRKGSGKQVLNKILYRLSTRITSDDNLENASEELRTGLLLLGTATEEHFELMDRIKWASSFYEKDNKNDPDELSKQGIATVEGDVFISDIAETIMDDDIIKNRVMSLYPMLGARDYDAALFTIWLLTISTQMFSQMLSTETDEELGLDEWVSAYTKKMNFYRDKRKMR